MFVIVGSSVLNMLLFHFQGFVFKARIARALHVALISVEGGEAGSSCSNAASSCVDVYSTDLPLQQLSGS